MKGLIWATKEQKGLITYMRTDSVRIAPEAIAEARQYIQKHYGNEYLPCRAKHIRFAKKRPRCPRSDPPYQLDHLA